MKNYYNILGVEVDATQEDIKAAYKFLAKKFHPDLNQGDTKSKKYFQEIQEAYECLSDFKKKSDYDQKYQNWKQHADDKNAAPTDKSESFQEFTTALTKCAKVYGAIALAVILGVLMFYSKASDELSGDQKLQLLVIPPIAFSSFFLVAFVYFLPTYYAYKNAHEFRKEIFILNLFSIFANLLTPLTFIVFYVCLLIYSNNKIKGVNTMFMAIIAMFFTHVSNKNERSKR